MKFEFYLPTAGKVVPDGPDWFHEIKYDGYRLRVEREGDRVPYRGGRSPHWIKLKNRQHRTFDRVEQARS